MSRIFGRRFTLAVERTGSDCEPLMQDKTSSFPSDARFEKEKVRCTRSDACANPGWAPSFEGQAEGGEKGRPGGDGTMSPWPGSRNPCPQRPPTVQCPFLCLGQS